MLVRCHSRRRIVHGDYRPGHNFLDYYQPELIEEPLYTADGQIRDEVYEYGSFHESRMFRENVRCSDCHDSHSLKLRLTGNALCLRCHTLAKGQRLFARAPPSRDRQQGAQRASSATCPSERTWSSIPAATIACVCQGPI